MANEWDIGRVNVLLELFSDWSRVDSFDELIAVLASRLHWILNYDQLHVVTSDALADDAWSIEGSANEFRKVPLVSINAASLVLIRRAIASATPAFNGEEMLQIAYPLSTSSAKLGALCLSSRAGYSYRDLRMIHHVSENFANVLGRLHQGRVAEDERGARREAEAANSAKDDFLAILGHELRNPLAPILTASEILKRRLGDVPELKIIQRQARHMHRLVDDMLDLSRLTRGAVQLKLEAFDLRSVIDQAVESVAPIVQARRHSLRVDVGVEPLLVEGDPTRLTQVFSNLLNNAALYTPEGGEINVIAKRVSEHIEVNVQDNGAGISPALLQKIFSPFIQGEQGISRDRGGLGLGLAIARSLTELHAGALTAVSAGAGLGSSFQVRLNAFANAQVATQNAAAANGTASAASESRRVLIVDDNVDLADTLAEIVSDAGYTVDIAYDPPAALAKLAESMPDIALLDIGLPVMDGYELARKIIDLTAPHPPLLIAVTGYGTSEDRLKSRNAGFNEHLVKPVDFDQLLARMATLTYADNLQA